MEKKGLGIVVGLLILALMLSPLLLSQLPQSIPTSSGKVYGTVKPSYADFLSHQPVNATVLVSGPINRITRTSSDGSYSVDGLPAGDYVAEAWDEGKPSTVDTQPLHLDSGGSAAVSFTLYQQNGTLPFTLDVSPSMRVISPGNVTRYDVSVSALADGFVQLKAITDFYGPPATLNQSSWALKEGQSVKVAVVVAASRGVDGGDYDTVLNAAMITASGERSVSRTVTTRVLAPPSTQPQQVPQYVPYLIAAIAIVALAVLVIRRMPHGKGVKAVRWAGDEEKGIHI